MTRQSTADLRKDREEAEGAAVVEVAVVLRRPGHAGSLFLGLSRFFTTTFPKQIVSSETSPVDTSAHRFPIDDARAMMQAPISPVTRTTPALNSRNRVSTASAIAAV